MNVENVVNPPQKPTVRNIFRLSPLREPLSNRPKTIPARKHPSTFTTNVPHGKVGVPMPDIPLLSRYREIPPMKLPAPIAMIVLNIFLLLNLFISETFYWIQSGCPFCRNVT